MADYNTSAIGRFRFDDSALSDAYTKAGQLMQSTLQNIGQQERADFKAKQEQERLDREEARQVERDRQAKILFDRNTDQYNKELATEEALKNQSKIGTTGYQEGTGLLGKYAEAANAEAEKAYNEVLAKTNSEDKALDAYSSTRSEAGKKLWNDQQNELKYNNNLINAARQSQIGNLEKPIDTTKLTQALEIKDKSLLQKQLENKDELAAQLLAPETTVKGIAKANEKFKEIVGSGMSSGFLNAAITNAKSQEFQEKLQKDNQTFQAGQRKLDRDEAKKALTAKQTADLNDSLQKGAEANGLAVEHNIKIPNTITEGGAKLHYVQQILQNKKPSTGSNTANLQKILDNANPGWIDNPAASKAWSKQIGKSITINKIPVTITPDMVEQALEVSLRRHKTFDLNFLQGVDTDHDSIQDTIKEVYLYNHPSGK